MGEWELNGLPWVNGIQAFNENDTRSLLGDKVLHLETVPQLLGIMGLPPLPHRTECLAYLRFIGFGLFFFFEYRSLQPVKLLHEFSLKVV